MSDYLHELAFYGLTARIKRLSDQLNSEARKIYKSIDYDVEPNWHLIFLLLKEQDRSVTEISREIGFSHPAVIKIVQEMKRKGYVESRKDPTDSRRQILYLTAKSKAIFPELEEYWAVVRDVMEECVTPGFLESLAFFEQSMAKQSASDRFLNKLGKKSE